MVAMDWIRKHPGLFRLLEWISLAVIIALAVTSFIAAAQPSGTGKNVLLSNTIHRFWLGVMLSAINPVQIPFWFGWSTALFTRGVLKPVSSYYNLYIMGIGFGTFLGNLVFIFGGRFIVETLNTNQKYLHLVIGIIFLLTALIFVVKLIRKKDAISEIKEN